jgi:hypothetical protein
MRSPRRRGRDSRSHGAPEVPLRSLPSRPPLLRRTLARHQSRPVEARHQEDLDTLRDLLRTAVALESRCDYDEPPTGHQPNRQALLAHFPELRASLEEWDTAVERERMAPSALWEWFAIEAAERRIAEPSFAVGSLIDHLAILTLQRARNWQLDIPYDLSLKQFRDRIGGKEYVSIHVEGQRVARLPTQSHTDDQQRIQAVGRLMQRLFDDAQASKEARAVVEARDSLLLLKEELLDQLHPRSADTPTLLANRCPFC